MSLVIVNEKSEIDQRISALGREATQWKSEKNFDKAIECLREVWRLLPKSQIQYGIKTWLRLPAVLLQAGRFDEALNAYNQLIGDTQNRVLHELSRSTPTVQEHAQHRELSLIHEKIAAAYQKKKILEQADGHLKISIEHDKQAEKLSKKAEKEREKARKEFEKKQAAMKKRISGL